jgi:hypothetical protein
MLFWGLYALAGATVDTFRHSGFFKAPLCDGIHGAFNFWRHNLLCLSVYDENGRTTV